MEQWQIDKVQKYKNTHVTKQEKCYQIFIGDKCFPVYDFELRKDCETMLYNKEKDLTKEEFLQRFENAQGFETLAEVYDYICWLESQRQDYEQLCKDVNHLYFLMDKSVLK